MSYIGSTPGVGKKEVYVFTATGGETSVSTADDGRSIQYDLGGYVEVFLNGVRLIEGDDYTATTGSSITGLTALAASDVLVVTSTSVVGVADTVSAENGGTFNGDVTRWSATDVFTTVGAGSIELASNSPYPFIDFKDAAADDYDIRLYQTGGDFRVTGGNIRTQGVSFGGFTASETLDDYEEGTFTPSVLQGFGTVNYNSGSTTGSYTRIGNRVFWTWRIATTSQVSPSTNSVVVSTPLVLSGSKAIGHLTMWLGVNVDSGRQGGIGGYTTSAGTGFLLYMSGDSISWSPITGTDLGTGSFQMIGVGQGTIA